MADVDSLVKWITAVHPDPFTVVPGPDFRARIDELKRSLPDSVSGLAFYLQLSPIVASLGDGHTSLSSNGFLRQSGDSYFPLELSVDPQTLRMTSGGRGVAQIGGVAAREIVRAVLATQSGESEAFRVVRAGYQSGWPVWVSVLHPAEMYTVRFDDGETVHAAGTTRDKVVAREPGSEQKPDYTYRVVEEKNAAVLEFNSFNNADAFRPFLDSMFTDIQHRGVDKLIIDLRANGGGDSGLGDELFQYISPVPFRQFGRATLRYSDPLRRFYSQWELSPQDTVIVYPQTDDELLALRENPLRFAGGDKKVYVLTSPITFSSAANFSWVFQYFDMGTIVGQETGGYIVCFGDVISLSLPHSRMRLGISWKEFYGYGATEADRRPVRPDIEIPAAEALDYVLEKLIE